MRIFWIGFHVEGRFAFDYLLKNNYLVGAMSLTQVAANKRSGVFDYKTIAEDNSIPFYEVDHVNDSTSVEFIKGTHPDLLIVLGWSQILNDEVLSIPKIGTIGAHASLLPKMRGSAPINWALIKGHSRTGNTLIWLDTGVDTGKIIDQIKFDIDVYDSCNSLYEKVARSNAIMLEKSLPLIALQGRIGYQQIEDDELLPRRKPADGLINFQSSAQEIYDFIRALTQPYPGAFFYYQDKKVTVWKAGLIPSDLSIQVKPSIDFIYSFDNKYCGIGLKVKGGTIIIHEIQVEKKIIKGKKLHKFFIKGDKL